jgi:hypothetical protein
MPMRLALFGAVLVAACAGSSGGRKRASPEPVVCVDEAPLGSHIVETRCYTRGDIEARNDRNRAAIERMQIRHRPLGQNRPEYP